MEWKSLSGTNNSVCCSINAGMQFNVEGQGADTVKLSKNLTGSVSWAT